MKKSSIISLLVSLTVFFCVLGTTAYAAEKSPFTDVPEGKYYYAPVVEMYESGVINGYGNGRFGPSDSITRAQVLAMVCRMAGVSTEEFATSSRWFSGTENWAKSAGIIPADLDVNKTATREEIACYITEIYELTPSSSTDGFADTSSVYANTLKDYGISIGYFDANGAVIFGDSENVKRCDVCVMLSRLKQNVGTPDRSDISDIEVPTPAPGYKPTAYNSIEYTGRLVSNPKTQSDYTDTMRYMMMNGITSYTFTIKADSGKYFTLSSVIALNHNVSVYLDNAYLEIRKSDPAYTSFYDKWEVPIDLIRDKQYIVAVSYTLTLNLDNTVTQGTLLPGIRAYEKECTRVIDELTASGKLNPSMTDKEKAKVLFEYVDHRFAYDSNYVDTNDYTVITDDLAVCQGYTDFYTSLCLKVGIPLRAVYSKTHVWNYIDVNGVKYFIDVTWGDPLPNEPNYSNTSFFWITAGELLKHDPSRRIVSGY